MTRASISAPATVHTALLDALHSATSHNRSDGVAPAAVLWTDKERHWKSIVPSLRHRIPLLTLGPYNSGSHSGPAIWLRCAIAGTLPEVELQEGTPVIYLPGVARADLRAVEDCPRELQPLAELQYRGVIFSHPNGRDWTPAAFLGKKLAMEITGGYKTQNALTRALPELLERPISELRALSPIGAGDLDELLVPDPEREILVWLDHPRVHAEARSPETKAAFVEICNARYDFDPISDGELDAVGRLIEGAGAWKAVWERYVEAPLRYPNVPSLLDRAEPTASGRLFEETSQYRPKDNKAEEDSLRDGLLALEAEAAPAARGQISRLESRHGIRRQWVWAELGQSSLARALLHLAALAEVTETPPGSGTTEEISEWYAADGWSVDAHAMHALAAVESEKDAAAIRVAVRSLYSGWLEECASRFQQSAGSGGITPTLSLDPDGPEPGVCTLFTDGLRYDFAQRLREILSNGAEVHLGWRYAPLPTVTPTAKPMLSPVRPDLGPGTGFGAEVDGARVTAHSLRKLLVDRGYEIIAAAEVGDPSGSSWTEGGDLDALGHARGSRMAQEAENSLQALAERIRELLEAGWREVRVVTDHGWLLLPGGLPKTVLPEHLTEVRKGRCARLKPGAHTGQQTIPWSLDAGVSVAIAPGISAYEAGKEYEHGGLSPQECVVPILTVTADRTTSSVAATIAEMKWTGLRCKVRVEGAPDGAKVDLRSRAADPSTSITGTKPLNNGAASLPVADDTRELEAAILVALDPEGNVLAQAPTVVGV